MTDNEMKRLSRQDLLELLLEQVKENELLKQQLEEVNKKLNSRTIALDNAGSIAEASLSLNGVFEAAQAASAQYLENIQRLSEEQDRISAEKQAKADQIISDAEVKAQAMISDAKKQSDDMMTEAKQEADKCWADVKTLKQYYEAHNQLMDLFSQMPERNG